MNELSKDEAHHQGSCLCGAVRFQVDAPIEDVSHCHCSMCRKAHGAACGTYANVAEASHRFVEGEAVLRMFRSSASVERLFCSCCGSPLLWRDTSRFPGLVSFPLGSLDTPLSPPSQRHIFVGSKADWHTITDDWPQQL